MAGIYRTVEVGIWQDVWFEDLDPASKLMFFYLLTNSRQTPCGAFAVTMRSICHETNLTPDQVQACMAALAAVGKVMWWPESDWVFLVRFYKRQRAHSSDRYTIAARKAAAELPPEVRTAVERVYPELAGNPLPLPYPMPTPSRVNPRENDLNSMTKTETETGEKNDPSSPDGDGPLDVVDLPEVEVGKNGYSSAAWPKAAEDRRWIDAAFEERFWPLYPRKTHKAVAKAAWARAMARAPCFEEALALSTRILEVLNEQKTHWTDPTFTPHAGTYLSGQRWTDEVIIPTARARHPGR